MKIAILGIGGIGGIVGGPLARVNSETYFMAHGANLEALRKNGLKVESPDLGNFTVRPGKLSDRAEDFGVVDAVIVACKGWALREACREMAPMVGPQTLVLPLLNGVILSDKMKDWLPPCILADGSIYVFSHLEAPGYVQHTAGACRIVMGMKDGSCPEVMRDLAALIEKAGLKCRIAEDILLESWRKYITMGSSSALFCYYDAPAGPIQQTEGHEKVLAGILNDMKTVAAATGVQVPQELLDKLQRNFETLAPDTVTSLYRDLRSGKDPDKTELESIIGRMVELGEETGIPVPYHKAAYERWAKKPC